MPNHRDTGRTRRLTDYKPSWINRGFFSQGSALELLGGLHRENGQNLRGAWREADQSYLSSLGSRV